MKKEDLINFAKFIFRSGEESFRLKHNIELDVEIEKYIKDTFKNYLECLRNKYKDEPKFDQKTEVIGEGEVKFEEADNTIIKDGKKYRINTPELAGGLTAQWLIK